MSHRPTLLNKVGTWISDHATLVAAGVILLLLIIGFSAGDRDFAAFTRALDTVMKHYKKADRKIDRATSDNHDRTDRADRKRDEAKKLADTKLIDQQEKIGNEQDRIERETLSDLKKDRDRVAAALADDLGVGVVR